jgi:endonuclease/exonuclease/phosphatase family metal-dependent hydrolase
VSDTRGSSGGGTLRVMTYNILLGGRRRQPLRDVVRAAAPDVLLVNESPKTPLLWRWRCHRLARDWGMRFVVGGRPAGSNMVLVRAGVAVPAVRARVLPQPRFQPRRGIAAAQLEVDGRPLGVVSCHLSLDRARRLVEVAEVVAVADRLHGTVVVAGDLNERPDGPAWAALRRAGFRDHGARSWLTFPAERPDRRIDALLVRDGVEVSTHGDPGVPATLLAAASDHRPVLAVLGRPDEAARPNG